MATPHETISTFLRTRFRTTIRGPLGPDDPLFSRGIIDSFGVLELIAFLEDAFHVEIDPSGHELEEFDTINKIAALVHRLKTP